MKWNLPVLLITVRHSRKNKGFGNVKEGEAVIKNFRELSWYRDPKIFRVNELEDHAYFIPFHDSGMVGRLREESEAFYLLNGMWKFHYEPSIYLMDDFYRSDYDDSGFETVKVPECWQLHHADRAQYQSSPYTFIFDPPNVPEKNPAAAYCKEFDFAVKERKRYELHFEGKDSCIYVWLNGSFVGYGEVPHNDSAFDITSYLRDGKNRLCVMVLKWCSGSYLDDQDKLRLSGLFRDVYILERSENGIRDFRLETQNDGSVKLSVKASETVEVQLSDHGKVIGSGRTCDGEIAFQVNNPVLWSAEKPYLYEILLYCDGEYILHRFGFRQVCIRNGVFMVNDMPVKLYGVNRHDANPDTGYVVDTDFIRKELIMMKKHNINAIRTAHYPNDPRFYELCDELGFYVLSEADMECHGCYYVDGWAEILDKPLYAEAIHDRITRMLKYLKNYTCFIIWSMGNESFWGENLKREAYYVRGYDNTRLLHYEPVFTKKYDSMSEEEKKELNSLFDFYCHMYKTLDEVERIFEDDSIRIPYLLSEYSHAMGNSGGDLRFYDEIFQKDLRFAGGFVWEWCDHGIRLKDEDGKEYMAYGGDFGEHHHLTNVCQDGLVTPDRVPHSALKELKAVYAPIRIEMDEEKRIFLWNRCAFSDLKEYEIKWTVMTEEEVIFEGTCAVSGGPGERAELPVPTNVAGYGPNTYIVVKAVLPEQTNWAEKGYVVAGRGFFLTEGDAGDSLKKESTVSDMPVLAESRAEYVVCGKHFAYIFRKDEGILSQMIIRGKELLEESVAFNCFRAPTDNDLRWGTGIAVSWNKTREFGNIEYPELSVKNFKAYTEKDSVVLSGDYIFSVQGRCPISTGTIAYRIQKDGTLEVSQKGAISEKMPYWLPRYGYKFTLKKEMEQIKYLGLGEAECYEDKRSHAVPGVFSYQCDDPLEAYERPQECGSHCDTRWLKVTDGKMGFRVLGKDFSFNASHYDVHQASKAAHQKDLVREEKTYLHVDYRMSGVGSASVGGQPPIPECRINPGEEIDFTIYIQPI